MEPWREFSRKCHSKPRDLAGHFEWRRRISKSLQWRPNERDCVSITSLSIVYPIVCSGVDQRKHQSSASLAFVRGIHRWPPGEFPAHRASNAENVSIWWHHHGIRKKLIVTMQKLRIIFVPRALLLRANVPTDNRKVVCSTDCSDTIEENIKASHYQRVDSSHRGRVKRSENSEVFWRISWRRVNVLESVVNH